MKYLRYFENFTLIDREIVDQNLINDQDIKIKNKKYRLVRKVSNKQEAEITPTDNFLSLPKDAYDRPIKQIYYNQSKK
jgi:hypothetical protein